MATGIPAKERTTRKKIPVELVYDGKESADEILDTPTQPLRKVLTVNGGENNKFYFGDNFNILLFLLQSGYKNKIELILLTRHLQRLQISLIGNKNTHIVTLYVVANMSNFYGSVYL